MNTKKCNKKEGGQYEKEVNQHVARIGACSILSGRMRKFRKRQRIKRNK